MPIAYKNLPDKKHFQENAIDALLHGGLWDQREPREVGGIRLGNQEPEGTDLARAGQASCHAPLSAPRLVVLPAEVSAAVLSIPAGAGELGADLTGVGMAEVVEDRQRLPQGLPGP